MISNCFRLSLEDTIFLKNLKKSWARIRKTWRSSFGYIAKGIITMKRQFRNFWKLMFIQSQKLIKKTNIQIGLKVKQLPTKLIRSLWVLRELKKKMKNLKMNLAIKFKWRNLWIAKSPNLLFHWVHLIIKEEDRVLWRKRKKKMCKI